MKKSSSAEKSAGRRSSCGAPIPSFKSELDQLERELEEDDDDLQQWRKRKERRRQNKELTRDRPCSASKVFEETVSLVRRSHGGANDDDEDDDDDGLLSFDFRRKHPPSVAKETDNSDGPVPMDKVENNDDETYQFVGHSLDENGVASEPLADATNNQRKEHAPVVGAAEVLTKPASRPDLTAAPRPSPRKPKVAPPETIGVAPDTLSQAVAEIFERSDVRTCTCKQVWKQLEERHGFKLDSAAKRLVRSQLTVLTQQYLAKMSHSTTMAPVTESNCEETANDSVASTAGAIEQSAREPESHGSTVATVQEKGMQAKHIASSAPTLLDCTAEKGSEPGQPRDVKSEIGSSQRKGREAPKMKSEPMTEVESGTGAHESPAAPPPQPKRRVRPPKAPKITTNPKTVHKDQPRGLKRVFPDASYSDPATEGPSLPARTKAKRNQPQCSLCKACPCRHPPAATATSVLSLAQSDSAVEKALMRRLLKLEEASDRYDEQAEAVRRKLKKHRREMWRKLDPTNEKSQNRTGYRFLPDAEVMDRESTALTGSMPLGESAVRSAKGALFSFASTYQPTLTQMFGGPPKKDGNGCDEIVVDEPHPGFEERESQVDVELETEASATREEEDSYLHTGGDDDILDFERVETRNGVGMTEEASRIWGAYSTTGGFNSLWDRIFNDPKEAEGLTLEQLETMFDDVPPPDSVATESSQVGLSMLTQRGQLLAEEIRGRINVSPGRASRLNSACPKWQENVLFALHQGSAADVQSALAGVFETQSRLRRSKEAMLTAIEAQEDVLNVFAEALAASLTRFDGADRPILCPSSTSSQPKQTSRKSIDRDDDAESETKTLSVSSSSPLSSQD